MASMETTRVKDVMVTTLITVQETDRMDEVAKLFEDQAIHAAPVLTKLDKCVGVITSHDIVEYQAKRKAMQKELGRDNALNIANYRYGIDMTLPGHHFEEVGFHMSKKIDPASPDDSLSRVAKEMCSKHRHHVLVLDEHEKPIGMLSSLDLLAFVTGEPVCRDASLEPRTSEN